MGKSVRKNFAWNAAYQLLLILTPLLTTPYLSRVLGPEKVGVYSYTYSVASYFAMFGILGMAQHGVRAIAQAGGDRERRSRIFWSAWSAQLCVAVPVTLVYVGYVCFDSVGVSSSGQSGRCRCSHRSSMSRGCTSASRSFAFRL